LKEADASVEHKEVELLYDDADHPICIRGCTCCCLFTTNLDVLAPVSMQSRNVTVHLAEAELTQFAADGEMIRPLTHLQVTRDLP
jgi:hypothetical protein